MSSETVSAFEHSMHTLSGGVETDDTVILTVLHCNALELFSRPLYAR
jgi:hypothetical protein